MWPEARSYRTPPRLRGSAAGRRAGRAPDPGPQNAKSGPRGPLFVVAAGRRLESRDFRRDEDQQLTVLIADRVTLEQPSKQRQPAEARCPVLRGLLAALVDAANHG